MLELLHKANELQKEVLVNGWDRKKTIWKSIDADDVLDFPEFSESDLEYLTLGAYQLKKAVNYTQEHLKQEWVYMRFFRTNRLTIYLDVKFN